MLAFDQGHHGGENDRSEDGNTSAAARQRNPVNNVTVEYALTEAFPTWQPDENVNSHNSGPASGPTSGLGFAACADDAASVLSVSTTTTAATTTTSHTAASSTLPPSRHSSPGPATPPRSRRTRSSLANRSQPETHAARVQRSATVSSATLSKKESIKEKEAKTKTFQRHSLNSNGSADTSSDHQSNLVKMEMQKWITVQQKTFTKW